MHENYCSYCKKNNRSIAKFCRFCGTELSAQAVTVLMQDKAKALESLIEPLLISSDYIGLLEIRGRLSMFITTLSIRQRQKKIGMAVLESNSILVFSGETGYALEPWQAHGFYHDKNGKRSHTPRL